MSLYDAPSWWKKYVSKDKKVWDSYGAPFFESLVLGLWVSGLAAITTLGVLTMIGLFVGQPQGFVAVGTVLFLVSLKLYGALLADRRFTQMHQEKGLNVGRAPPIVDGVSFGFAWYAARSSLPILSSNEFLSPILALLFVMAIATVVYTAIHISGHYGYSDVVVPWINSRIPDLNLSPMSLSSSPNLPPYILQSISNVFDSGGYPDFKRLWIDPQWNEDQKREFALMVEIRFGRWVLEQSDPEILEVLIPILTEEKNDFLDQLGVEISEIQELAKPQIKPSVPPPPAFQEEPDIPKPKTHSELRRARREDRVVLSPKPEPEERNGSAPVEPVPAAAPAESALPEGGSEGIDGGTDSVDSLKVKLLRDITQKILETTSTLVKALKATLKGHSTVWMVRELSYPDLDNIAHLIPELAVLLEHFRDEDRRVMENLEEFLDRIWWPVVEGGIVSTFRSKKVVEGFVRYELPGAIACTYGKNPQVKVVFQRPPAQNVLSRIRASQIWQEAIQALYEGGNEEKFMEKINAYFKILISVKRSGEQFFGESGLKFSEGNDGSSVVVMQRGLEDSAYMAAFIQFQGDAPQLKGHRTIRSENENHHTPRYAIAALHEDEIFSLDGYLIPASSRKILLALYPYDALVYLLDPAKKNDKITNSIQSIFETMSEQELEDLAKFLSDKKPLLEHFEGKIQKELRFLYVYLWLVRCGKLPQDVSAAISRSVLRFSSDHRITSSSGLDRFLERQTVGSILQGSGGHSGRFGRAPITNSQGGLVARHVSPTSPLPPMQNLQTQDTREVEDQIRYYVQQMDSSQRKGIRRRLVESGYDLTQGSDLASILIRLHQSGRIRVHETASGFVIDIRRTAGWMESAARTESENPDTVPGDGGARKTPGTKGIARLDPDENEKLLAKAKKIPDVCRGIRWNRINDDPEDTMYYSFEYDEGDAIDNDLMDKDIDGGYWFRDQDGALNVFVRKAYLKDSNVRDIREEYLARGHELYEIYWDNKLYNQGLRGKNLEWLRHVLANGNLEAKENLTSVESYPFLKRAITSMSKQALLDFVDEDRSEHISDKKKHLTPLANLKFLDFSQLDHPETLERSAYAYALERLESKGIHYTPKSVKTKESATKQAMAADSSPPLTSSTRSAIRQRSLMASAAHRARTAVLPQSVRSVAPFEFGEGKIEGHYRRSQPANFRPRPRDALIPKIDVLIRVLNNWYDVARFIYEFRLYQIARSIVSDTNVPTADLSAMSRGSQKISLDMILKLIAALDRLVPEGESRKIVSLIESGDLPSETEIQNEGGDPSKPSMTPMLSWIFVVGLTGTTALYQIANSSLNFSKIHVQLLDFANQLTHVLNQTFLALSHLDLTVLAIQMGSSGSGSLDSPATFALGSVVYAVNSVWEHGNKLETGEERLGAAGEREGNENIPANGVQQISYPDDLPTSSTTPLTGRKLKYRSLLGAYYPSIILGSLLPLGSKIKASISKTIPAKLIANLFKTLYARKASLTAPAESNNTEMFAKESESNRLRVLFKNFISDFSIVER
ncbi:MAG: hypothetical protein HY610_02190, partial [Elusimicrobia bacterium]|nr:hypothetical protein [Elusimicrobiota bacterium]